MAAAQGTSSLRALDAVALARSTMMRDERHQHPVLAPLVALAYVGIFALISIVIHRRQTPRGTRILVAVLAVAVLLGGLGTR